MSDEKKEAVSVIREQVQSLENSLLSFMQFWQEETGLSIESLDLRTVDSTPMGGPRESAVVAVLVQIATPR